MEGWLPIFFLLVVLKIPVFAALWLVWWASRAHDQEVGGEDSGGGFGRRRPLPVRPRGPHDGPGAATRRRRRGALPARRPAAHPAYARGGSPAGTGGSPPGSCDA